MHTLTEVERYLMTVANRDVLPRKESDEIKASLKSLKAEAVRRNDEAEARLMWCYETVLTIQENYIAAFSAMKEHEYYSAWCLLERVEIGLMNLSSHFSTDDDRYMVDFIGHHTALYQSLFPYTLFISTAFLHLEKECSICGRRISIGDPCGHIKGEIYAGEQCFHIVTKTELLELSVTPSPKHKYAVLFTSGAEPGEKHDNYDYSPVAYVVAGLRSPFDAWEIERTRTRHPHSFFEHVEHTDPCPCGSGKQYGDCCLAESGVLRPHLNVMFSVPPPDSLPPISYGYPPRGE